MHSNRTIERRKLIIDTNVLLLIIVGSVGINNIGKSKRLEGYNDNSYKKARIIMNMYKSFYITHYIATEVSNLIDFEGELEKIMYFEVNKFLKHFQQIDTNLLEESERKPFYTYGITDSSLLNLSNDYAILTGDEKLYKESIILSTNTTTGQTAEYRNFIFFENHKK